MSYLNEHILMFASLIPVVEVSDMILRTFLPVIVPGDRRASE